MTDKSALIKEAKIVIALVDAQRDDTEIIKVPNWLKINNKLRYYFDWKSTHFEKGVGWYWDTERVWIDEGESSGVDV